MDTSAARGHAAQRAGLLSREQSALAEFLVSLAEFDRQRHWEPLGFVSLRHHLHRGLGLSRSAAFHRKEAARLLPRFPAVEAPLRDGRLSLSRVAELAKVLIGRNLDGVLPRFFHRSARESREVVAELVPRVASPERAVVTGLQQPEPVLTSEPGPPPGSASPMAGVGPSPQPTPDQVPPLVSAWASAAAQAARPEAEPLTADLRRLHVTVSRRFLEELEEARDAHSHSRSGSSGAETTSAARASKHVPAETRRAAWLRDGGRCRWRLDGGGICVSTRRLELDHILPRARGGPSRVENLRVLCHALNQVAARLAYGDRWRLQFGGPGRRARNDRGPPDRRRLGTPVRPSPPQTRRGPAPFADVLSTFRAR